MNCSRLTQLGVIVIFAGFVAFPSFARDDGRYAQSQLKPWFDSLKSGKGYCCSDADGRETEYEMRDGSYWVPIDGEMVRVPSDSVITSPNLAGRAMLWLDGSRQVRCFIPGSGA